MEIIETTTQSSAMADARATLMALSRREDDLGLQAAEAFWYLGLLVHPPYPPVQPEASCSDVTLVDARRALEAAADATDDVEELGRITLAGHALNTPPS